MVLSIALQSKECEEILATVSPHKKKQLEDPKNLEDIKKLLTSSNPAWLIGLDTTVIAANLPALSLWNVLSTEVLQTKTLPYGLRTLDTFADNFDRIPLEENKDFYRKKSIDANVIKLFYRNEAPIRKFKEAMLSDPQRKAIYEEANPEANPEANKHEFKTALDFTLNIRPPQESKSDELLRFKVGANLHFHGKRLIGWGAVYNPLGETKTIISKIRARLLEELLDEYGTIPYVITDTGELHEERINKIMEGALHVEEGGDTPIKEAFKRFFPKKEQPGREVEDSALSRSVEEAFQKHQEKIKRLSQMPMEEAKKELGVKEFKPPRSHHKHRRRLPV